MMKDSPYLPFLRGVLEKQLKSSWSGDDCFLVLLFRIAFKKVGVMTIQSSSVLVELLYIGVVTGTPSLSLGP